MSVVFIEMEQTSCQLVVFFGLNHQNHQISLPTTFTKHTNTSVNTNSYTTSSIEPDGAPVLPLLLSLTATLLFTLLTAVDDGLTLRPTTPLLTDVEISITFSVILRRPKGDMIFRERIALDKEEPMTSVKKDVRKI